MILKHASSGLHLAAVAPVATRMNPPNTCPARIRQQPELGGGGIQASPVVAAEHSQPGLAPAGDVSNSFPAVNLHSKIEAFFPLFLFVCHVT